MCVFGGMFVFYAVWHKPCFCRLKRKKQTYHVRAQLVVCGTKNRGFARYSLLYICNLLYDFRPPADLKMVKSLFYNRSRRQVCSGHNQVDTEMGCLVKKYYWNSLTYKTNNKRDPWWFGKSERRGALIILLKFLMALINTPSPAWYVIPLLFLLPLPISPSPPLFEC